MANDNFTNLSVVVDMNSKSLSMANDNFTNLSVVVDMNSKSLSMALFEFTIEIEIENENGNVLAFPRPNWNNIIQHMILIYLI
jgi:hypothetical protein